MIPFHTTIVRLPLHGIVQRYFKGENGSLFYTAATLWGLRQAISRQVAYSQIRYRRHSATEYLAALTYINQEESLPEPVLDLALLSA